MYSMYIDIPFADNIFFIFECKLKFSFKVYTFNLPSRLLLGLLLMLQAWYARDVILGTRSLPSATDRQTDIDVWCQHLENLAEYKKLGARAFVIEICRFQVASISIYYLSTKSM